jgi:hypothetical protein
MIGIYPLYIYTRGKHNKIYVYVFMCRYMHTCACLNRHNHAYIYELSETHLLSVYNYNFKWRGSLCITVSFRRLRFESFAMFRHVSPRDRVFSESSSRKGSRMALVACIEWEMDFQSSMGDPKKHPLQREKHRNSPRNSGLV